MALGKGVGPLFPQRTRGWHGTSLTSNFVHAKPEIRRTTTFRVNFGNTDTLCVFAFLRKGYIINAFTRPRRECDGLSTMQLR